MKKIILIILIFLTALQTYAFEDYVLLSEIKVNDAYSKDESIVSIAPFFTLDNSKETLILKAKQEGSTIIVLETENDNIEINVQVNSEETILEENKFVSSFPIDFLSEPKKPIIRGEDGSTI